MQRNLRVTHGKCCRLQTYSCDQELFLLQVTLALITLHVVCTHDDLIIATQGITQAALCRLQAHDSMNLFLPCLDFEASTDATKVSVIGFLEAFAQPRCPACQKLPLELELDRRYIHFEPSKRWLH